MNASTRIKAEIRALFGPWCAVLLAQFSSYLPISPLLLGKSIGLGEIAFWFGVPLLATLPFGNEFQHGTLSSLLSQPVDRMKIWREKFIVASCAVLSVALFSAVVRWSKTPGEVVFLGAMWVAIALGSAVFWTLTARSTIGGLTINALQLLGVVAGSVVVGETLGPFTSTVAMVIHAVAEGSVTLGYASLLLWLGRRKLARFEVSGTASGNSLLTGNATASGILSGLLRSRRAGASLNLVRKEVRLLWPLWFLTLGGAAFVICLAPVRLMSGNLASPWVSTALVGFFGFFSVLAAVLAGSVSLAEERNSGTHQFHMTLPVSIRRQWLIKLSTALLSSLACVGSVMILARTTLGPDFVKEFDAIFDQGGMDFLALILPLTFAAFWCASAVKGTLRAALWVFPVLSVAIIFAGFGFWLGGEGLIHVPFMQQAIVKYHPYPPVNWWAFNIWTFNFSRALTTPALVIPLLLITSFQSYRQFRSEPVGHAFSVVRRLSITAIFLFVVSFAQQSPYGVQYQTALHARDVFAETADAVDALHLVPEAFKESKTLQFSPDELNKARPLSELTRKWLGNAPVIVTQRKVRIGWIPAPASARPAGRIKYTPVDGDYVITLNLQGNWMCNLTQRLSEFAFHRVSCKAPDKKFGLDEI